MSDDSPQVPIHCPACETTSRVPLEDVGEAVERHNEQLHDGEDIAHVDDAVKDELANLLVEELGLLEEE